MDKKKLLLSDDEKMELSGFRKKLEGIQISSDDASKIYAGGGCGGICKITCSWWCENNCQQSCMGTCYDTCLGGYMNNSGGGYCAYKTFPHQY